MPPRLLRHLANKFDKKLSIDTIKSSQTGKISGTKIEQESQMNEFKRPVTMDQNTGSNPLLFLQPVNPSSSKHDMSKNKIFKKLGIGLSKIANAFDDDEQKQRKRSGSSDVSADQVKCVGSQDDRSLSFSIQESQSPIFTLGEKLAEKQNNRIVHKSSTIRNQIANDGEFILADNRIVKRSTTSLIFQMDNKNKLRRAMMQVTEHKKFDNFIMGCIILNSIAMGMFSYYEDNKCIYDVKLPVCPVKYQTSWNRAITYIGHSFGFVFTLEAAMKIIALGCICGKKAYFRSSWNTLDFIIVISSLIELGMDQINSPGINMRAIRTLRILRPLKAMKTIPSLRKQIKALIHSIIGLVNVVIFLVFVFLIFGIMGLQWFSGYSYYACREGLMPPNALNHNSVWPKYLVNGTSSGICTTYEQQVWPEWFVGEYQKCPENFENNVICGSSADFGLNLTLDGLLSNSDIQYGYGSFDNFFQSMIAVFQIITLDSWTVILYNLMNQASLTQIPTLFCVSLVFLGAFFLLNLMLAVVMESYMESESRETERQEAELKAEKTDLSERLKALQESEKALQESELKLLAQVNKNTILKAKDDEKQIEIINDLQITQQSESEKRMDSSTMILAKFAKMGSNKKKVAISPANFSQIHQPDSLLPSLMISGDDLEQTSKVQEANVIHQNSLRGRKDSHVNNRPPRFLAPLEFPPIVTKYEEPQSTTEMTFTPTHSELENNDQPSKNKFERKSKDKYKPQFPSLEQNYSSVDNLFEKQVPVNINDMSQEKSQKLLKAFRKSFSLSINRVISQARQNDLYKIEYAVNQVSNTHVKEQMMQKIHENTKIALLTNNIHKKSLAQQKIKNEGQIIMNKMSNIIRKKYSLQNYAVDDKGKTYGLKNEDEVKTRMQQLIKKHSALKVAQGKAIGNEEVGLEIIGQVNMELQKKQVKNAFMLGMKKKFQSKEEIQELASFAEAVIEKDKMQVRAEQNKCYMIFYQIVKSKTFTLFVSVCILLNTVILALDRYPSNPVYESLIEYTNLIFYGIFLLEMIVKLLGQGTDSYFKDAQNILDMIIVVMSTIDVTLYFYSKTGCEDDNEDKTGKMGAISQVLRISRLVRVFKLARTWRSFNYFLTTIGNTMTKISSFIVLLALFLFMFTIVGMEMFSNTLRFNYNNEPIPYYSNSSNETSLIYSYPPYTFDTISDASMTVFVGLANDGWTTLYFNHARVNGLGAASAFFISLVVLGQMILFNLFLAILLKEFDEGKLLEDAIEQRENSVQQKDPCYRRVYNKCKCKRKPDLKIQAEERPGTDNQQGGVVSQGNSQDNSQVDPVVDKVLNIFTEEHTIRKWAIAIEGNKDDEGTSRFDQFILLIITISSIALAFENPLNNPDGHISQILKNLDYFTTTLFLLEVFIRVLANGFLFNGSNSYLRQQANILDFTIVVISTVSMLRIMENISIFKIIRMARLLRPLRVISKNENLKLSMQALWISIPAVTALLVIVILFFFIFAIIGINILKGKSFSCDTHNILLSQREIELLIDTKWDCLNYGGFWVRHHRHFDTIQDSMIQMVVMSQTVNWPLTHSQLINSRGEHMVPGYKESKYLSLFFLSVIIFCALFIMNLFVGVIINAFNNEQERLGKNFLLTDNQRRALETKILALKMRPTFAMIRHPTNKLAQICYDIAIHPSFELAVLFVIFLNTIVMMLKWLNMSQQVIDVTEKINYVFTVIFIIEAIIKLIAFQSRYFRDMWNVFDFCIVVTSILGISMAQLNFNSVGLKSSSQVIRTFRIGRMFKLFRKLKQLQVIFTTFISTLSSIMNVGGLMFLLIYIYAVIGVSFFAPIKWNGPINNRLNFTNIQSAIITLIRAATGESWDDLMNALGHRDKENYQCKKNPTYADYISAGTPVGCGNFVSTYIFFGSYLIMITLVFLNLFIAIILNGYFDTRDQEGQRLSNDMMQDFKDGWAKFDPDATGIIEAKHFAQLLFEVGEPLGWGKYYNDRPDRQLLYFKMAFENNQTQFTSETELIFNEVLDSVSLLYVIRQEVEFEKTRLVEAESVSFAAEPVDGDKDNTILDIVEESKSNSQSSKSAYCTDESQESSSSSHEEIKKKKGKVDFDRRGSAFLMEMKFNNMTTEVNEATTNMKDVKLLKEYNQEMKKTAKRNKNKGRNNESKLGQQMQLSLLTSISSDNLEKISESDDCSSSEEKPQSIIEEIENENEQSSSSDQQQTKQEDAFHLPEITLLKCEEAFSDFSEQQFSTPRQQPPGPPQVNLLMQNNENTVLDIELTRGQMQERPQTSQQSSDSLDI